MSTPLSPIHKKMTECPLSPYKGRLPHLVMEYNLVAREVVGRMDRVEFMDTNLSMMPLFDVSFDGTHYQGPVGRSVAKQVLAKMVENDFRYSRCDRQ